MTAAFALGFAGLFFPILAAPQGQAIAHAQAAAELPLTPEPLAQELQMCEPGLSAEAAITGFELSYASKGVKFPSALRPAANLAAQDCVEQFLNQIDNCGGAPSGMQAAGDHQVVIDRYNYFSGYTDFRIDFALSSGAEQTVQLNCSARLNSGPTVEIDTVSYDRDQVSAARHF